MTRSCRRLTRMEPRRRRFKPMNISWNWRSSCAAYELSEVNILRASQPTERTKEIQGPANSNDLNPNTDTIHPGRTVSSFSSSNSANSAQFYRLPKISLPSFSGDIMSFWDSYESIIHSNANLTDVQKFTYLKSQLEGTAARVVEGFAMTNANYVRATDLLKE